MSVSELDGNLSARSSLAIVIVDRDGIVRSSSALHAWRLGRRVDETVGQHYRSWLDPASLEPGARVAARVLSGEPQSFLVTARRPDGRIALSRSYVTPLDTREHGLCILGLHTGIVITDAPSSSSNQRGSGIRAVPSLVRDLAAELAGMASTSGLVGLADSLEAVAGEVGDFAAKMP